MKTGYSKEGARRAILTAIVSVCSMIVASYSLHAQESSWPVPGKAPVVAVGASYGLNAFDKIYRPMHQATVFGAMRGSPGTAFLKLTRASRFNDSGFQGELELYPVFSGGYAYVDYAYGEYPVFPRHRLGLEAFVGLPWSLEASLGARYFDFQTQTVTLATGSVSYYSGAFVFILRPFLGLDAGSSSFSANLATRYYMTDDEFVFFRFGGGFSPDERWIQSSPGISGRVITFLQSQTVGCGIQLQLTQRLTFLGNADATRQEVAFSPGMFVLDFATGLGFRLIL